MGVGVGGGAPSYGGLRAGGMSPLGRGKAGPGSATGGSGLRHAQVRALGIVAVAFLVLLASYAVLGERTFLGLPGVVSSLILGLLACSFELVVVGVAAAIGILCIFFVPGAWAKVFGLVEMVLLVWVIASTGSVAFMSVVEAARDLASEPVLVGAEYAGAPSDGVGGRVSVYFDDGTVTSWAPDMASRLESSGIDRGERFEVWVYPHTHVPVEVVGR